MWEVKGKVLDEKNKEHIYIGMKKGNQNYSNYTGYLAAWYPTAKQHTIFI